MVIRETCPRCGSPKYKKNGRIHNGKQNHQCKDCGRQFVQGFAQYRIADDTRALIERLLVERISLRGICRAVGVGRHCQINSPCDAHQSQRSWNSITLVPYAAIAVPVISRHVWKRCRISCR